MSELEDFEYFKVNQLVSVDFTTGILDTKRVVRHVKGGLATRIYLDVGSSNPDGYIRLRCNQKLRMKHRLLWWLNTGTLPDEIDHIDGIRWNNAISNLRSVTRKEQLQNINYPCRGKKRFKFTDEILHEVCLDIAQGISDTQISKRFKCSRTAITGIRTKRRHSAFSGAYF